MVITMPDISRIQVQQHTARIGINTTRARVEISNAPRAKMRIVTEHPHMEVEHKAPAFRVEPQHGRAVRPLLLRNPAGGSAPHAATRRGAADLVLESVRTAGKESDSVMDARALELNKAINDYLAYAANESAPQSLPAIEWEAGYINITWSKAQTQIEWDKEYMPSFSVEPHSVEIFLREKPYIRITISDEVISAMYGPKMDEEI